MHNVQIYLNYHSPYYSRKYAAWNSAFKLLGLEYALKADGKGVLLFSDSVSKEEALEIYRLVYSRF